MQGGMRQRPSTDRRRCTPAEQRLSLAPLRPGSIRLGSHLSPGPYCPPETSGQPFIRLQSAEAERAADDESASCDLCELGDDIAPMGALDLLDCANIGGGGEHTTAERQTGGICVYRQSAMR